MCDLQQELPALKSKVYISSKTSQIQCKQIQQRESKTKHKLYAIYSHPKGHTIQCIYNQTFITKANKPVGNMFSETLLVQTRKKNCTMDGKSGEVVVENKVGFDSFEKTF